MTEAGPASTAGTEIDGRGEGRDFLLVRHRRLVIVLLGAVLFVASLALRDLWHPDEPAIAEVAKAMYESGDWVTPRRNGVFWVDYPPLLYWAGCATSSLLGEMTPFSLRLPSALGAILLALATCAATSRAFGGRAGLWAGVLLLTFTQFAYNAVAVRTDMLFALFIGCGTLLYAAGLGPPRRLKLRVLGFALLGLAVLVKGPLGLLLPGLVLTLFHLARREWRSLLGLFPLGLVAVAVALPWYLACASAPGGEDIWRDIYAQNFERWESGIRYQGHIRPLHYYVVNLWADLAPFVLLLPFAIFWVVRRGLWRRPELQLAFWWFGAWVVFLTIAATKRQLYLLPAYPAAAMLLAPYLAAIGRPAADVEPPDPRPAFLFVLGFSVLLAVGGLGVVFGALAADPLLEGRGLPPRFVEVFLDMRWAVLATGAVAVVLGASTLRTLLRGRIATALAGSAATIVVLLAMLLLLVAPGLNPLRTYEPAGAWIRAQIGDAERIGLHYPARGRNVAGAFIYYSGAYVDLVDDEQAVEAFLRRNPDSLVLVREEAEAAFFEAAGPEWKERVVRDDLHAGRGRYTVLRIP